MTIVEGECFGYAQNACSNGKFNRDRASKSRNTTEYKDADPCNGRFTKRKKLHSWPFSLWFTLAV